MKLYTSHCNNTDNGYRYLFDSEPKPIIIPQSFPDIDGFHAFKADLHLHTTLTDGSLTPEQRIDEAKSEGIDVIALTDHTPYMWGEATSFDASYDAAVEYGRSIGVTVIKGVELTCSKPIGHLNLLFINECKKYQHPHYPVSDETAIETLRAAHAEGAFVVINHPGWPDHDSTISEELKSLVAEGVINAMEVFSMHEFYPSSIDDCNNNSLAILSSTDLHKSAAESYDLERRQRNFTVVYAKSNSASDIKEALLARRTIAVAGDMVAASAQMMQKFIKSCVTLSEREGTEWSFIAKTTNQGDINFVFQGEHSQHFMLKAHCNTQIPCLPQDQRDSFFVRNAYVSADENPTFTLQSLLDVECNPNAECQHASGTDYPRSSYFCHLFKGQYRSVDEIEFGRAAVSDSFSIPEATNQGLCPDDTYGAFMERLVNAEVEKDYTFAYSTNGLLRAYVDHRLVFCNDSMCRITNDAIKVHLCRGWHILQLFYVQDFKGERMSFRIE